MLLVSPIHLGEGIENSCYTGFAPGAVAVSKALAPYYKAQAEAHGWLYFDASTVAGPSEKDKLHMEAEDHEALARAFADIIKENL